MGPVGSSGGAGADAGAASSAGAPPVVRAVRDLLVQAAVLLGLMAVYLVGRALADGELTSALEHATDLFDLEDRLGLPSELGVQQWLLGHDVLARGATTYYAAVHFPLTGAALVFLHLRRRALYRWTRDVLMALTAAGLVLAFVFPLAPPRLVPSLGFVDLGAALGPSVYGPPGSDVANQFAAMPSLHVGWALLVGTALARAGRTPWRWLWLLHPLVTVLVVVGTGNHYWTDAVVAAGLLLVALAVVSGLHGAAARRWTAPAPGGSVGRS